LGLKKEAVPAQAGDLVRDGLGTAPLGTRDLAIATAADDRHKDTSRQFWTLLPVGCRERLCTEVTLAGETRKPLDTLRRALAIVKTLALVLPNRRERIEVATVRIRAVRWHPL
jgi:hypothetical protein